MSYVDTDGAGIFLAVVLVLFLTEGDEEI